MDCIVTRIDEESGKQLWQLGIDEEPHAALNGATLFPEASAPNSRAASRSSRSRSGWSRTLLGYVPPGVEFTSRSMMSATCSAWSRTTQWLLDSNVVNSANGSSS